MDFFLNLNYTNAYKKNLYLCVLNIFKILKEKLMWDYMSNFQTLAIKIENFIHF